jgi:hypothetical protein
MILARYPKSKCARYCEAYLAIAEFKELFGKQRFDADASRYEAIAGQLAEARKSHLKSFYAEPLLFYQGYALALARQKPKALDLLATDLGRTFTDWPVLAAKLRTELITSP